MRNPIGNGFISYVYSEIMRLVRILILEDDNQALALLLHKITKLETQLQDEKKGIEIAVTVLAEYTQVEDYVNKVNNDFFDIILLDRDCKAAGSFHALDIEAFGPDKIISISSIPDYNEHARQRGVRRVVHKNFDLLNEFADKVIAHVREML